MKRIVAILVLFLYLIPVIGVSLNAHYCGGKLHSIKIGYDAKNSCGCKGAMKKNCCSNKTQFLKVDDDQQASAKINVGTDVVKLLIIFSVITEKLIFNSNGGLVFSTDTSPPLKQSLNLFLLNRVFRI